MRPDRHGVVHLMILLPSHSHTLSPWGGVVLHLGQWPTLRRSCRWNCLSRRSRRLRAAQRVRHKLANTLRYKTEDNTKGVTYLDLVVVVVVVVVVGYCGCHGCLGRC